MNLYDADRERWLTDPTPFSSKGPADMGAHADQPTRDKYASRDLLNLPSDSFASKSDHDFVVAAIVAFVAVSLLFAVPLILAGIMLFSN